MILESETLQAEALIQKFYVERAESVPPVLLYLKTHPIFYRILILNISHIIDLGSDICSSHIVCLLELVLYVFRVVRAEIVVELCREILGAQLALVMDLCAQILDCSLI